MNNVTHPLLVADVLQIPIHKMANGFLRGAKSLQVHVGNFELTADVVAHEIKSVNHDLAILVRFIGKVYGLLLLAKGDYILRILDGEVLGFKSKDFPQECSGGLMQIWPAWSKAEVAVFKFKDEKWVEYQDDNTVVKTGEVKGTGFNIAGAEKLSKTGT